MEKIQQEFEAWLKSGGNLTMKEDDGQYSFQHTRFAFEAWKASRAALCVELPCGYIGHPYRFDILSAIDECRLALEDAGVEYK